MINRIKYLTISLAISPFWFLPYSCATFFGEQSSSSNLQASEEKIRESMPTTMRVNNLYADLSLVPATRFSSAPTYPPPRYGGMRRYPLPAILGASERQFLESIYAYANTYYANTNVDLNEELSKLSEIPPPYTNHQLPKIQTGDYVISIHLDSQYLNLKRPVISFVSVYSTRGAELIKYHADLYCYHNHIYMFQPPDILYYLYLKPKEV